ncbi:hypothetical protein JAB9_08950 [Janthinobacterium sp. HH107]|uniref:hypothetical protein n=1 Tax=Janthinobacterium sp. HH107 TaxID=1537279 RepID=UPI000893E6A2|nr:hypothetical protein [Janthinobacterium sp. HH107]OFA05219.1 hypothetical protein JAB9_08950 [Janthinobacterium sp. HH107]
MIESRIDGEFSGWEGETVVNLVNGQIWKQSEYFYHYHYSFRPKVTISKENGAYKMVVEGIPNSIRVERQK